MAIQSLLIILIVLILLLALGVPIAYSIGISALVAILQTVPLDVSVVTAAQRTFVGMSKFSLTAIPFFILAGNLMNQGGIAKRLVDFVMAILGKLPGALLVTNVGANALFGAISGSASAAAAAVGSMVKEGEEEQGYDPALCAATNGASAPSGLLIPPSNALITYSLASGGTSVAALFLGGYVPGILWALCCIIVGILIALRKGYTGTPGKFDWKNLGVCTLRALPGCLCTDSRHLLPQYYRKILLEHCCGQCQDERHGCVPHRCIQYPWLGYGIYPDPAGGFRSTAGRNRKQDYHSADYECHPADCRHLYGRYTGNPDFHTAVPAYRTDLWYASGSLWPDSGI